MIGKAETIVSWIPKKIHVEPDRFLSQAECLFASVSEKRRAITWKSMLRGEWEYTTSVGAYVGRWVPWIGAVLTAYDLSIITGNVVHRYMLITGGKG